MRDSSTISRPWSPPAACFSEAECSARLVSRGQGSRCGATWCGGPSVEEPGPGLGPPRNGGPLSLTGILTAAVLRGRTSPSDGWAAAVGGLGEQRSGCPPAGTSPVQRPLHAGDAVRSERASSCAKAGLAIPCAANAGPSPAACGEPSCASSDRSRLCCRHIGRSSGGST